MFNCGLIIHIFQYATDIVASDLILLGGRGEGGGGGDYNKSSSNNNNFDQRTPEPEAAPVGSGPISDEDIPF